MQTILIVVVALTAIFAIEFFFHRRARRRIPLRIHVNGIRGKSSVVRLIAAGLQGGGVRTWAKVTGTLPNLIDDQGEDVPMFRGGPASIIEQRAIVSSAAGSKVDALVIECMALDPAFQRAETSLLQPTVSVITNIRPDHEEVFGSSLLDVALALSNTVPRGGILITTAGDAVPVLRRAAEKKQTQLVVVGTDDLPDSLVEGFTYVEHKDNVAVALEVCERAGVSRDVALTAMRNCPGDPGALRIFSLSHADKKVEFISALAANDPISTKVIYERLIVDRVSEAELLVLVNTRKDRPLRSLQLGRLLGEMPAAHYFITGNDASVVIDEAVRAGVLRDRIKRLVTEEAEDIVEDIVSTAESGATILAIGNTAGSGLAVSDYFRDRGVAAAIPVQRGQDETS